MPPYLELDRNSKSVPDISTVFSVSSIDSYHDLKKYFFRLSPRDDEGISWCSVILAQSIPFPIFMVKVKYSLENNDLGLWPKATDNENTIDAGWLLYSTRAQDEERLSSLLSELIGENIGVKWKPVRSSTGSARRKDQAAPEEKTKALHVECGVDRLHEVREKLTRWYSSNSTRFPDGTKMCLVPTITSVTSISNKSTFASCLARQAALNAGLASVVTREISTNLLLDRKDPSTNKSFRQVLMEISPKDSPGTTLFHTIDRQFKSDVIVNFQFHPDHASEAHNLIAGLVPFLKDNGHAYHLKMFTPEALQRQAKAKWNQETREADSETDAELANLLAEDDDLNYTNEPTLEKSRNIEVNEPDPIVAVQTSPLSPEHIPKMGREEDLVSTFHPGATINLTEDSGSEEDQANQEATSSPTEALRTSQTPDFDAVSRISTSDSATRISLLESNISEMEKAFREEINKLQYQALQQAKAQSSHGTMLTKILSIMNVGHFGDRIEIKEENILRIGFQNIGGFPIQRGKLKEDNIRQGITKWDIDIFGMAEVNLDWRLVKEQDRLPTRTKEWWPQQYVCWAHNKTIEPRQPRQYGGTAIFSVNKAALRAIDKGCDGSNLGRWAWTKYKGKSNKTLRIITAYRPNPPQGPFTIYAQQNAHFHTIQREICPRQAFLVDLIVDLRKFGLDISKGGYFEYDQVFPSDHRCVWMDISFTSAFGHNMPPLFKRQFRRLHCKDPRLVQNYIKLYHQYAGPKEVFKRVQDFEKRAQHMSGSEIIKEYEVLDCLRCEITANAERRCRKLRTGQVAFSPELNACRLKIKAWTLLISRAKRNKINSRLLKRELKKACLPTETRGLPLTVLEEKLKEEHKIYHQIQR